MEMVVTELAGRLAVVGRKRRIKINSWVFGLSDWLLFTKMEKVGSRSGRENQEFCCEFVWLEMAA